MKLLKSAICLLNRHVSKESVFATNRLYSDIKTDSNKIEIAKSIEQTEEVLASIEQTEKLEPKNYNETIERRFQEGVSITTYSTFGFRLNQDVQVVGPIIVFPRAVFSWNVESAERINADSLMLFGLIQPRIETLIIGIGQYDTTSHIGKNILEIAHKHKINIEILTTELACTQFNYLTAEGRMVAAALIPPKETRMGEDDSFHTLSLDSKLFTMESMHTGDIQKLSEHIKKGKK